MAVEEVLGVPWDEWRLTMPPQRDRASAQDVFRLIASAVRVFLNLR